MIVGREQIFPLLQGPRRFLLSDDKFRYHKISFGYVSAQKLARDALNHIRNEVAMNLNAAKGLSPFSAFSFPEEQSGSITALERDLGREEDGYPSHLTDIFIVMKVVSMKGFAPMNWMNFRRKNEN